MRGHHGRVGENFDHALRFDSRAAKSLKSRKCRVAMVCTMAQSMLL
jgi:hypothetical protein